MGPTSAPTYYLPTPPPFQPSPARSHILSFYLPLSTRYFQPKCESPATHNYPSGLILDWRQLLVQFQCLATNKWTQNYIFICHVLSGDYAE